MNNNEVLAHLLEISDGTVETNPYVSSAACAFVAAIYGGEEREFAMACAEYSEAALKRIKERKRPN
jgi:hypothetical protein